MYVWLLHSRNLEIAALVQIQIQQFKNMSPPPVMMGTVITTVIDHP